MRNLTFLIAALFIIILSSCEKVIDIDLKNTDPVIVIEANVDDIFGPHLVKISQTKPFTDDNNFVPVLSAEVSLKDLTENRTYIFRDATQTGNYVSVDFKGTPGNKYELSVIANNKTYTATSTMPQKVALDSLTITELSFFGESQKFIQVNYNDPANIANQYNYVLHVNGEIRNAYYVDSDRFNDGKKVTNTIFNADPELKKGDEISIEFQCIDNNIYRYFFAISQISGNGGPPTAPANPTSNFNNGALGYFNAHTSQTKSAEIP